MNKMKLEILITRRKHHPTSI